MQTPTVVAFKAVTLILNHTPLDNQGIFLTAFEQTLFVLSDAIVASTTSACAAPSVPKRTTESVHTACINNNLEEVTVSQRTNNKLSRLTPQCKSSVCSFEESDWSIKRRQKDKVNIFRPTKSIDKMLDAVPDLKSYLDA